MTSTDKRSLLKIIFISEDEHRLRAGWRLVVHALLLLLFTIAFGWIAFYIPYDDLATILIEVLIITFATWTARRNIDRRSFRSLGFQFDQHTIPDLLAGFILPAILFGVIYGTESVLGWLQFKAWAWQGNAISTIASKTVTYFLLFIGVAYAEELLSRGYHLQNLAQGINLPWAILLSSTFFSILHLANPHASLMSVIGIIAAGSLLAYAWVRTRNLWLPIGLHLGWNFFEGPIFGFPVSGSATFGLIQHENTGPILVTGGPFGPEAGLIVLPVLLIGAWATHMYTNHRTNSG